MRLMNVIKAVSILSGLGLASQSLAINLASIKTYETLVPSSLGKNKPASFEQDMLSGRKLEKQKLGCRFVEKSQIYMFDDVVVITDAADTKFFSYKIETVIKKGCSLPSVQARLTTLPDGDTVGPMPYGSTNKTEEVEMYSTRPLDELLKEAELDPIEAGKDQEAGMGLLLKLDQGVQLTEVQHNCRSVSKKPLIYAFPDWMIYAQEADGVVFYDAVPTATVKATAGCAVPNFLASSTGTGNQQNQCVQAPRIENDGLVGNYRQGFSLDTDAAGQPISGSNRIFAYILKKSAAASPSIVNDVRKVVAVQEKVTMQPNAPTIVRIDNDQVVFAGSTKTGARIVAIEHQAIEGSDMVTIKDQATGFTLAGLSKGDSMVFRPEDQSFYENFTNIGFGIYFRPDGLIELNYKDPRIGSRYNATPVYPGPDGFGPTEAIARDNAVKTCAERNVLAALRGEVQSCFTDPAAYIVNTQNSLALGSIEKSYNVTPNLCGANPAEEDVSKRPVEFLGKYIRAVTPTRHNFILEAGRREWYFVAKLNGQADFLAKAKELISYAKTYDLTLEPASKFEVEPAQNDIFLIAYATVQGVRADLVKYDATQGALQKFYNLDSADKVEYESGFEINPASSDIASDVNSLLKYYIGLDYGKVPGPEGYPVTFSFNKNDLY